MPKKLSTPKIRTYQPTEEEVTAINRNDIYLILDNILDTYNIGGIFRIADAIAAQKIFLVGESATPDDKKSGHKIVKASVGTYKWVPWQHVGTVPEALAAIEQQRSSASHTSRKPSTVNCIAIEQTKDSINYQEADYRRPLALIVGHETTGVSKEGLELAGQTVEIPLFGVNKSLNVIIALALVSYKALEK